MNSNSSLFRLLNYARKYRPTIHLACLYSIINKLFDIAPEILIGIAIDVVVNTKTSFLSKVGIEAPSEQLFTLGVLTFLIWASESLFEYLYLIKWRYLAQSIQQDLRVDGYRHVQDLPLTYFEDQSTGNLTSILNDDVNQLERFLNGGANSIIQVLTTIVAIGGIFFYLSPRIAFFAFAPIPVILFGAFYFQKKAGPLYKEVRSKVGELNQRLTNNISGITTIKSFTAESIESKKIEIESQNYCLANKKAINLSSAFIPIIRMAILSGFLSTLVYGGWLTMQGELNVGFYGVMVFLTQRLLWPLTGLAETADLYERAMASTNRILNLLDQPVESKNGMSQTNFNGDILFQSVNFSYDKNIPVLKNIDLEIKTGKTIGVVGPTGSGKSTLTKLLLGFYSINSGRISVDGVPIEKISKTELRKSIGLVNQDIYLFPGTVKENLLVGNSNAKPEEIKAACDTAEILEFIESLPNKFDTVIGERGQKLSGGQKQRLAIARALLKDPPVMIFDEATSAVDNETEAAIQRSLRKIESGRTTIIIAHRLSTILHADVIYVMENGNIVESGNSNQLLSSNGLYKRLWNVQINGQPNL